MRVTIPAQRRSYSSGNSLRETDHLSTRQALVTLRRIFRSSSFYRLPPAPVVCRLASPCVQHAHRCKSGGNSDRRDLKNTILPPHGGRLTGSPVRRSRWWRSTSTCNVNQSGYEVAVPLTKCRTLVPVQRNSPYRDYPLLLLEVARRSLNTSTFVDKRRSRFQGGTIINPLRLCRDRFLR